MRHTVYSPTVGLSHHSLRLYIFLYYIYDNLLVLIHYSYCKVDPSHVYYRTCTGLAVHQHPYSHQLELTAPQIVNRPDLLKRVQISCLFLCVYYIRNIHISYLP